MLEKIISFRGGFSLLDSSSTIQIIAISKVHTESAVPRSDFNLDALVSATIQVKTNFYEITKEFYIPSPLHCFLNVKKDEFFNTMHIDELEEFGLQWAFNNKLYKGNERGLRATFVAGLTGVCYPFTPIKVQERLIKLIDALFAQDDELDRSDEGCKLVISRELQISNSKLFNLISNVSKKSIEIRTPLTTWQYYYERQIDDFLKSDYPTLIMHLVNDLKIDETNVCVLFDLTLDYFNDYDVSSLMTSLRSTEYRDNNDPHGYKIVVLRKIYDEYKSNKNENEVTIESFLKDMVEFKDESREIRPLDRNEILAYEFQSLLEEYPWLQETEFRDQLDKYFGSIVEEAHANNLNIKKSGEVLSDTRIEASGAMCTLLSGAALLGVSTNKLAPDFNVFTLSRLVSRMVMITNDIVSFYKELKELFQKVIREDYEEELFKIVPELMQSEELNAHSVSSSPVSFESKPITPVREVDKRQRSRSHTLTDERSSSPHSFFKGDMESTYNSIKDRLDTYEITEELLFDRHFFVSQLMKMDTFNDALTTYQESLISANPIIERYQTYLIDKDKKEILFKAAFDDPVFLNKISKRVLLNTVFSKWTESVSLFESTQKELTNQGYKRLMRGAIEKSIEDYNEYTASFFEELSRLGDKLDVVLESIAKKYDNYKRDEDRNTKIKINFKTVLKEVKRYEHFYTFMSYDLKRDLGSQYRDGYLEEFKVSLDHINDFSKVNPDINSILENDQVTLSQEKSDEMCDLLKEYTVSKTKMDVHLFKDIVLGWSFQVIWAFSAQRYNLGKVPGSEALIKKLYNALNTPFDK